MSPLSGSIINFLLEFIAFDLDFALLTFYEALRCLDGTLGGDDSLLSRLQLCLQLIQFALCLGRQQCADDIAAHGTGVSLVQRFVGLVNQRIPVLLALDGIFGFLLQLEFAFDRRLFAFQFSLLAMKFLLEQLKFFLFLGDSILQAHVRREFLLGGKEVILATDNPVDVQVVIFLL